MGFSMKRSYSYLALLLFPMIGIVVSASCSQNNEYAQADSQSEHALHDSHGGGYASSGYNSHGGATSSPNMAQPARTTPTAFPQRTPSS